MGKSTLKLKRRIQLVVDLPTKEERKEKLDKLYKFQYHCARVANLIISHLYLQEMNKDFFYLSEGIKHKLADEKWDQDGIFKRSCINSTSRMVYDKFKGEISADILSSLNSTLLSTFNKNKSDYRKGLCSLRNYRNDMGFPFASKAMSKVIHDPDKKAFCFSLFGIPFKTYLGKDFTDRRKLMGRLVKGDIKLCTSKMILKDGKIFWLAIFEIEKVKHELNQHIIAKAYLSLEYPIVVKTSTAKLTIGNREEFLYRKLAIQAAYKRTQEGVTYCKSGKARKRKLKALEKLRDAENNYVTHRLHLYSRKLIDFCVKNQAGTLKLINQEDKMGIAKEEDFVLRNWSYDQLLTKIEYKADKAGIELITA
ncbi:hypothetical protein [Galbibacter sp.]|uniref:hypothetical protein n=1 Tax=Galbibacter sp. TaxID=2918471 RepID=UPI003A931EEF